MSRVHRYNRIAATRKLHLKQSCCFLALECDMYSLTGDKNPDDAQSLNALRHLLVASREVPFRNYLLKEISSLLRD